MRRSRRIVPHGDKDIGWESAAPVPPRRFTVFLLPICLHDTIAPAISQDPLRNESGCYRFSL